MRERVLIVFETMWDRPQLEACRERWSARYEVLFAEPSDADCDIDLDVVGHVAALAHRHRGAIDGVFSTSDYPGAPVAAAVADELGLRGPGPRAVLVASHKHASRLVQRDAAPEAVPPFSEVDPENPATWDVAPGFPCFVKPVKGAFSMLSERVSSRAELGAFVTSERARWFAGKYLEVFHRLAEHFELGHDGRRFVAEGLLSGEQVTVECWHTRSASGVLGVVDSTFRPGTRSFERFDYPSALPPEVQARMAEIALRAGAALGLVDTLFNVELVWAAEEDRIAIIEVNPRACGQFADLYAKVDGASGSEVALAVATGNAPPAPRRAGEFGAAASFPLRAFERARVRRAPDSARIAAVQASHPGTLVWIECRTGDLLDPGGVLEDGASCRYAVANLGGEDREDVTARFERVHTELGFELESETGAPRPLAR